MDVLTRGGFMIRFFFVSIPLYARILELNCLLLVDFCSLDINLKRGAVHDVLFSLSKYTRCCPSLSLSYFSLIFFFFKKKTRNDLTIVLKKHLLIFP